MKSALRGFLASVLILLASVNTSTASSGDELPKLKIQVSSNGHGTPITEGQSVVLGAMVSNITPSTTLAGYFMTVNFDSDSTDSVSVNCRSGIVLPGGKKTCTARFLAKSAEIRKGRITGSITVTAYDPQTANVFSATEPFATGHEDVPPTVLLPTQLYADGTTPNESGYNPAGTAPALNLDISLAPFGRFGLENHLTIQPISGRDYYSESGATNGGVPCNVNSKAPLSPPAPTAPSTSSPSPMPNGVLCAGQGQPATDPNGNAQTTIAIEVPSPTLVMAPMPVSITTPCGRNGVTCGSFPSYEATVQISPVDSSGHRSNTWTRVMTVPLCTPIQDTITIGGFTFPYGPWHCEAITPQITIPLTSVHEDVTFCISNSTPGGGSCTTPYEVRVEPTAIIKAVDQLQKLVYAPPGFGAVNSKESGAQQTFSVSKSNESTTSVSFGDSSSYSASATIGVAINAHSSQCVGQKDVDGVCVTEEDTLSASASVGTTKSSGASTTRIQSNLSAVGQDISASPITDDNNLSGDSNPYQPPWLGDKFDFFANPKYAIWDLSLCQTGYSSMLDDGSIQCPSGVAVVPRTTALPLISGTEEQVTAQTLVDCYQPAAGSKGGYHKGGVDLSSSDCADLLAQDPFAGTALGLVPTPVGETPGQSVNPADVLAQSDTANKPKSLGRIISGKSNGYSGRSFNEETSSTGQYSTSSSQELNVSAEISNTASIGVDGSVSTGMFSGDAGVSVSLTTTLDIGTTMAVNFESIKESTVKHSFTVNYSMEDPTYSLSASVWLDPRFDTVMFQMADTPTLVSHNLASVSIGQAVPEGNVSHLILSQLPLPIPIGSILTATSNSGSPVAFAVSGACAPYKSNQQDCPVSGTTPVDLSTGTTLTSNNVVQFSLDQATDGPNIVSLDGPAQMEFCSSDGTRCFIQRASESPDGGSVYAVDPLKNGGTAILETFAGQDGVSNLPLNATPYALPAIALANSLAWQNTPPNSVTVGSNLYVALTSGGSTSPVLVTTNSTPQVCSANNKVISFLAEGNCMIDVTQAGDDNFEDATPLHQSIEVHSSPLLGQSISWTTKSPITATVGASYTPLVIRGKSTRSVVLSLDSKSRGCVLQRNKVLFTAAGICVIDANQAGDDKYASARQIQQQITVKAATMLSITKVTLAAATRGRTYHPTTFKVKGATMGATLVWSATNLPRGMKLSSGGTLSGVPVSSLRPGTTTLMVKVTQSVGTKRTIATLPILLRVA